MGERGGGFTPGPWRQQGRAVYATVGAREIKVAGAKLYIEPGPESGASTFADQAAAEANARLIAAAPMLLEACRKAMLACQDNLREWAYKNEPALAEAFGACQAAVAEAEGTKGGA